jgi:hypothetical protein
MRSEEIKHMKETRTRGLFNQTDPIWIKAFSEYNNENSPLKMNCRICYDKILLFHIHMKPTQPDAINIQS